MTRRRQSLLCLVVRSFYFACGTITTSMAFVCQQHHHLPKHPLQPLRRPVSIVVPPIHQHHHRASASTITTTKTRLLFLSSFDNDSIMPSLQQPSEPTVGMIPDVLQPKTTTTITTDILETLTSTMSTKNGRTISTDKSLRVKLGLLCESSRNEKSNSILSPSTTTFTTAAVVGHRGALYEYLENTRQGFLHCAQLGCHAIELDVFVLSDGHVVVFHGGGTDEKPGDISEYCLVTENDDDDIQRKRNILEMTFEETQQLQFNPYFAEFACDPEIIRQARIPLLEHVLQDLLPYPELEIKIELKGPGVVRPVLELVEKYQVQHRCSYSSFRLDMLAELRTLRPDARQYPTGALFTIPPHDYIEQASVVGATEIHIRYDQCHVDRIQTIHEAGFRSMAWLRGPIGMAQDVEHRYHDIENEEGMECYRCLLETGVQQICCNKPDILLQLLSSSISLLEDTTTSTERPQLQPESISSWEDDELSISESL